MQDSGTSFREIAFCCHRTAFGRFKMRKILHTACVDGIQFEPAGSAMRGVGFPGLGYPHVALLDPFD